MVYWAPDPSDIPHGDMQRWFYTRDPGDPHITKARAERTLTLDIEDGPLAPERADLSANDWTEGFEDLKSAGHFEMIGATTVKPEYLLEAPQFRKAASSSLASHTTMTKSARPRKPAPARRF